MHPVNESDLEWTEPEPEETRLRRKQLAAAAGGERLGCSLYELLAGESGGHRVVNDSSGTLRYLVVSTMNDPDVTVYPDSEKFGVYVGSPPGGREERSLEGYYRIGDDVDYWEGE